MLALETYFTGQHGAEMIDIIRRNDRRFALEILDWFTHQPEVVEPFRWICDFATFKTQAFKGRFDPSGREYMRDPINDVLNGDLREQSRCCATGTGKTTIDIAQILYLMHHDPFSGLYVMPSKEGPGGARQFNNGSILPSIEATEIFQPLIPRGANRHKMSGLHIDIGANNIDFAGANSATQLSNKRCKYVWLGEQDKYKPKLGDEAGSDALASERTTGVAGTKVFRGSTPSVETKGIWLKIMESDLRRRFLPCPHCNAARERNAGAIGKGWMVLVWSDQFTVLPTKMPDGSAIPLAQMKWDREAKRRDGDWDRDRVARSARFECPHCGGHIRDDHRVWMDAGGIWIPTRPGLEHRGYHLPAWYAPINTDRFGQPDIKATYGGMALKFLDAITGGQGMGDWINSDAAEVNVAQEHSDKTTIEISGNDTPRISSIIRTPIMSCDVQQLYPKFWFIIREWVAAVLHPIRPPEQQEQFFRALPDEEKTLAQTIIADSKDDSLYSAAQILYNLQRNDHWPRLADWLVANRLVGKQLSSFYQVEFQSDLTRLIEFICKQDSVNIPIVRQGDSEAVEIGSADTWEELDDAQHRNNVLNHDVIIDARFGAMDNGEVFAECFRRCPSNNFCFFMPIGAGGKFFSAPMPAAKPFALGGWRPVMGFPDHKVWPNKDKIRLPYGMVIDDPFKGKMEARQFFQYVFQFDAQWSLSELSRIRKRYNWTIGKKIKFTGNDARMTPVTIAEYNKHMKGYYWDERQSFWEAPGKKGGAQSRQHPNHLYDCEKNSVAYATWKGIFKYQRT